VSSGGIADVFSACVGLQTDFWFEVMLGCYSRLADDQLISGSLILVAP
jgi:hypothetical protein